MKRVLLIDGMNFFHRARSGIKVGDNPVVFNFFRNLKGLVAWFEKLDEIYFVLEGKPKHRKEIFSEYKSNRILEQEDKDYDLKKEEKENFFRQVNMSLDIINKYYPMKVVKHNDYECDDTIYNIVKKNMSNDTKFYVVSTDTDFIQLKNEFPSRVKLLNPVKKEYLEPTPYDYVAWKALKGDPSDGIPGIPGIGEKTAEKIVNDFESLKEKYLDTQEKVDIFQRNLSLIKLKDWSAEEFENMMYLSENIRDWNAVFSFFILQRFNSFAKDKYKKDLLGLFDHLF